jgi:hypothetical protein
MAKQGDEPLSAWEARKIVRRIQKPRLNAPPKQYTVTDPRTGKSHTGTLKAICALCPNAAPRAVRRMLEKGERNLAVLREPPPAKRPHNGHWRSK